MTNVSSIDQATQDPSASLSNSEKLQINTLQGYLEGSLRQIESAIMMGATPDQMKESLISLVDDFVGLRESSGPERAIALILINSKNFLVQAILQARDQQPNLEENLNG